MGRRAKSQFFRPGCELVMAVSSFLDGKHSVPKVPNACGHTDGRSDLLLLIDSNCPTPETVRGYGTECPYSVSSTTRESATLPKTMGNGGAGYDEYGYFHFPLK
jgi:hypothetical protein